MPDLTLSKTIVDFNEDERSSINQHAQIISTNMCELTLLLSASCRAAKHCTKVYNTPWYYCRPETKAKIFLCTGDPHLPVLIFAVVLVHRCKSARY